MISISQVRSTIYRNYFAYFLYLLVGILFLLTACLAILSYRPILGYSTQAIISNSMSPAISAGSIVIARRLLPQQYRTGDVITFRVPTKEKVLVTHRVTRIYRNSSGVLVVETRGDANTNGDSWSISMGMVRGKVLLVLPKIGYLLQGIRTDIGFLLFSLTFFLLVVLREICWWGECVARSLKGFFGREPRKGVV